jgi:glycosyltransferase involved in cell wall biosynthesis
MSNIIKKVGHTHLDRKITFLSTGLSLAGAEIQLAHLAVGLKERGWNTQVISMLPPDALTDKLNTAGIPVATLNMRPGVPNPIAIYKLARLLRQWQPNVVHSHMVHANFLGRITRFMAHAQIPILISTAHNVFEGGRWVDLMYRYTDRFCDLTTNVSQRAVDRYIQVGAVPEEKIRRVSNGIDVTRFSPSADKRRHLRNSLGLDAQFVWLAVGRLEASKDYPNMVRAFAQVASRHSEAVLLIVGRGSLESEIRNLVRESGLDNQIRFLGLRQDIPDLMNAADAYLMSSAWEGLPMVLLEAAATGLPLVATDVGGNAEVVVPNKTGFIVPPNNATELARAMGEVMGLSEEAYQRLGEQARHHIETHFSIDRAITTWEGVYEEYMARTETRV